MIDVHRTCTRGSHQKCQLSASFLFQPYVTNMQQNIALAGDSSLAAHGPDKGRAQRSCEIAYSLAAKTQYATWRHCVAVFRLQFVFAVLRFRSCVALLYCVVALRKYECIESLKLYFLVHVHYIVWISKRIFGVIFNVVTHGPRHNSSVAPSRIRL